ncbi:hypothetical protein [Thermomonospora umbrina]|uniref:Mce-associated membrane protein n=1 Tax=Thermomonospora umbrina TaxID=111806 RepID=A0A3D9SI06_9ACTN|nr:hypothetical protein [Thermomonospora umbrina]REE95536.1 Mce-associated membrane protein [Thermomonospora umbrina]
MALAGITGRPSRPADPLRATALTLLAVAALCAVWFGRSWYGAANDDALAYSQTREEALRAGEQAVQNMNTLDHRNVDGGLKVWLDSSTGELHQQITASRAQFAQQVQRARTITTAKVLESAVTELDVRTGKAAVMVALQITVTPTDGKTNTKQSRMLGQLTQTGEGWKLSALGQAPVGGSAPQTSPTPPAPQPGQGS